MTQLWIEIKTPNTEREAVIVNTSIDKKSCEGRIKWKNLDFSTNVKVKVVTQVRDLGHERSAASRYS